jgi:hypothetical protein
MHSSSIVVTDLRYCMERREQTPNFLPSSSSSFLRRSAWQLLLLAGKAGREGGRLAGREAWREFRCPCDNAGDASCSGCGMGERVRLLPVCMMQSFESIARRRIDRSNDALCLALLPACLAAWLPAWLRACLPAATIDDQAKLGLSSCLCVRILLCAEHSAACGCGCVWCAVCGMRCVLPWRGSVPVQLIISGHVSSLGHTHGEQQPVPRIARPGQVPGTRQ